MPLHLQIVDEPAAIGPVDTLLVIGRASRLRDEDVRALVPELPAGAWDAMVRGEPGDNGRVASTYTGGEPRKVMVGVLPEVCSRHNSPSRAWAIPALLKPAGTPKTLAVIVAVDDAAHVYASGLAVARALPSYQGASRVSSSTVTLAFAAPGGAGELQRVRTGAEAVRFACQMVDAPPNQLTTSSLVETARQVGSRLPNVEVTVIQGEQLLTEGLGGLWNVGKASIHPPALVVLDWSPPGANRRVAWVGKGIVYDTGGLSIKGKTGMPGMKTDMAGAAAVLSAFAAAVQLGAPVQLTAALCIAENAVGPNALRPDDVITLYSGKTVEVNNTDAEGRLVLADGVSWVVKHRSPDEVVDLATLTGAQSIATGKRHAALYASDEELEQRAIRAGKASGELAHALPYVPEFFRGEFASPVADMKNSVKDRNNAQSSCAGQFIANHIESHSGTWLHVDMAAPAVGPSGRGTGYGVGLLLTLLGVGG